MGFIKRYWQERIERKIAQEVAAERGDVSPEAVRYEERFLEFLEAFKDWIAEFDRIISRRLVRSEGGFNGEKLLRRLFVEGAIVFEDIEGKPILDFEQALKFHESKIDLVAEKSREHARRHFPSAFPSSDEEIYENRALQVLTFIGQLYSKGVIRPGKREN